MLEYDLFPAMPSLSHLSRTHLLLPSFKMEIFAFSCQYYRFFGKIVMLCVCACAQTSNFRLKSLQTRKMGSFCSKCIFSTRVWVFDFKLQCRMEEIESHTCVCGCEWHSHRSSVDKKMTRSAWQKSSTDYANFISYMNTKETWAIPKT